MVKISGFASVPIASFFLKEKKQTKYVDDMLFTYFSKISMFFES